MPPLLNRVPTGRLICLHALLQHLVDRYGRNKFSLREAQYDASSDKTIFDTCTLLVERGASRTKVCPFLKNPLSAAKCYLTQSLARDTLKQKSVGDAVNALEALGLVDRINGEFAVNEEGSKIASLNYYTKEWLASMRKCAVCYGLFLGFLYIAKNLSTGGVFLRKKVKPRLAFPETGDTYPDILGNRLRVSSGCELDTMTRTTSLLIKWGVSLGYISEIGSSIPSDLSHVQTLEIVKEKNTHQQFNIHFSEEELANTRVERPIHYPFLTPDPAARRDLSAPERNVSMLMSHKIINRRYALIYSLGVAAEKGCCLDFLEFKNIIKNHSNFIVDSSNVENAMNLELNTAIIAGIPWKTETEPHLIRPLVKIDLSYLSKGAPQNVVAEVLDITKSDIYK